MSSEVPLFAAHAFGIDFALNDFMGRAIADHLQPGKFLLTRRTLEITGRAVFDNALHQTLYQPATAAFMILVQERLAPGAVNGDRANVAFGHDVTNSTKRWTTIASKTNFPASAAAGERVIGECTPLHVGRTTMVWQTRILRQDGQPVAQVTQTQLVLPSTA
jgi:hypothetical protein